MTRAVPAKTARYVGAYEDHLGLRTTETPFSSPVEGNRIAWGTVIEPPNVTATQANELEKREARPSRSRAISACWNEGHFDDETDRRPGGFSNPNHLLELHPTWRMQAQDGATRDYDVQAMSDYGSYGLSKLKTILNGFASLTWPTMYRRCTSSSRADDRRESQPRRASRFTLASGATAAAQCGVDRY
jgi:hypothetical protein